VAAGGAVARTFVAPESEWVTQTFRWYERVVDGEWVVRRGVPTFLAPPEKPSLPSTGLTAEELEALVRRLEKELTKVTKEYSDLCAQWRAR
jgi:hypothetical protein